MSMGYILRETKRIIDKYQTRNPFELARALGINVEYAPLGSLKGFYKVHTRNRFIVINNSLDRAIKSMVLSHEIGHDLLHRDIAKNLFLQEFSLFSSGGRQEYEANMVAAEILIDEDEMFELFNGGCGFEQTAYSLNVDPNLLAIKLHVLKNQGYDVNVPMACDNQFWGK